MKKRKTFFELIKIEYQSHRKPRYPSFGVHSCRVGIFLSLEKAEQAMNTIIEELKKQECLQEVFGFLINEHILNKPVYWIAESRRNYLPDGSLWDESLVSEMCEKNGDMEEFLGRPADKMRFQIGDLVEVLWFDTVTLEIVGHLVRTPDEVGQLHERNRNRRQNSNYDFKLDFTDDTYYTLDQYGEHSHPAPTELFPARLKVSKALRNKLLLST